MVDVKGFPEKEISKQIKVHRATVQSGQINGQITNQWQELDAVFICMLLIYFGFF